MVRRTPTIAPLHRELLPQDPPIPAYVELARDAPQDLREARVACAHLRAPFTVPVGRGGGAVLVAPAEFDFAGLFEGAFAVYQGAEMCGLFEDGGRGGFEGVEVRLEGVVVRK